MTVPVLMTVAALASSSPPLPGFLNALSSPLQHYGVWAIGLLILLEDFGIPVPGETILIAGAVYAGAGRLNVVLVGVVAFIAAIIGDNIGFAIGHFGGRALALRWGKYVFLTKSDWTRPRRFFDRRGAIVITFARFVEGLRQANGIIAGITGMHWLRFLIFNAIGAALWVGTWVSLGYLAGGHITTIYDYITLYSYYVLIALAVLLVGYVTWRVLRRPAPPHAAAATRAGEKHETRRTEQAAEIAPGEPAAGQHTQDRHAPGRRNAPGQPAPPRRRARPRSRPWAATDPRAPRRARRAPSTLRRDIGEVLPVQAQDGRTAIRHQTGEQAPERVTRSVRDEKPVERPYGDRQASASTVPPNPAANGRTVSVQRSAGELITRATGAKQASRPASVRASAAPVRVERPRLVLAGPVRLAPGRGVPDHDQRHRLAAAGRRRSPGRRGCRPAARGPAAAAARTPRRSRCRARPRARRRTPTSS